MTAREILQNADRKAREAIEDFGLAYHVKPNAVMAGNHFVNDVVGAVLTLNREGQADFVNGIIPQCAKLNQRTIAGLPIIVSGRNDAVISAVLVGKPEILNSPKPNE